MMGLFGSLLLVSFMSAQPSPPAKIDSMHSSAANSPACAAKEAASVRRYMSCNSRFSVCLKFMEFISVIIMGGLVFSVYIYIYIGKGMGVL